MRRLSPAILPFACLLLLGGCATTGPYTHEAYYPSPPAGPGDRAHLVRLLHDAVGTPYRYGGDTPRGGFDCSGLVYWSTRMAGYRGVPRTVEQQYRELRHVPLRRLRAGDVLFFRFRRAGPPSHDGIYIGHGRFIHSPATGGRVRVASLHNPFWARHLIAAARLPG